MADSDRQATSPTAETGELTIDGLAIRTGMTARNIRAHQSRGLLSGPTLRGRTGYYSEQHVARIELIQELQADGYSLELIQRILRTAGGSTEEVRRFTRALHAPFGDERPGVVELDELQRRFRSTARGPLAQAEAIGMLRPLGNGRYEEVTPQAMRGGEVFAELGVEVEEIAATAAEVRKHTDAIARAFIRLFIDHVWRPFEQAGRPAEGLEEILDAIERLRPVAAGVVLSLFQVSMGEAAEKGVAPEARRLQSRQRRQRSSRAERDEAR
jgi:DNA-binding transcriptional MerR regulator